MCIRDRVGIVSDSALSTPKLLSCRLDFTDGQDNTGLADAELGSPGASPYIQLSSNGQLQTEFSMGTAVNSMVSNSTGSNSRESHSLVSCMSAPLGPQTAVECIKHCFLFGDGVKSYNNALDSAIELSDLGRGYLAGSCRAGSCRAGDSRTAGRFSPE